MQAPSSSVQPQSPSNDTLILDLPKETVMSIAYTVVLTLVSLFSIGLNACFLLTLRKHHICIQREQVFIVYNCKGSSKWPILPSVNLAICGLLPVAALLADLVFLYVDWGTKETCTLMLMINSFVCIAILFGRSLVIIEGLLQELVARGVDVPCVYKMEVGFCIITWGLSFISIPVFIFQDRMETCVTSIMVAEKFITIANSAVCFLSVIVLLISLSLIVRRRRIRHIQPERICFPDNPNRQEEKDNLSDLDIFDIFERSSFAKRRFSERNRADGLHELVDSTARSKKIEFHESCQRHSRHSFSTNWRTSERETTVDHGDKTVSIGLGGNAKCREKEQHITRVELTDAHNAQTLHFPDPSSNQCRIINVMEYNKTESQTPPGHRSSSRIEETFSISYPLPSATDVVGPVSSACSFPMDWDHIEDISISTSNISKVSQKTQKNADEQHTPLQRKFSDILRQGTQAEDMTLVGPAMSGNAWRATGLIVVNVVYLVPLLIITAMSDAETVTSLLIIRFSKLFGVCIHQMICSLICVLTNSELRARLKRYFC